jgi:hypothetical protein
VQNTASRAKITVSADGTGLVSQAGMALLAEAARVTGLGQGLSAGLARWRAPRAVHDPGKIIADLATTVALGGDCLADVAVLRAQPQLAGPVASDPVISRLTAALAADGSLIPVDIDATIVLAHSEKEKLLRPGRRPMDSTRSPRSPTTAPRRAGSRWPSCCVPVTPGQILRPSTSR